MNDAAQQPAEMPNDGQPVQPSDEPGSIANGAFHTGEPDNPSADAGDDTAGKSDAGSEQPAKPSGDKQILFNDDKPEGENADGDEAKEGEAAEGDADSKDGEEAPAVTYEDFTLPDGWDIDANVKEKYQEVAAKHNLSQEAAQEFVDMYIDMQQKQTDAFLAMKDQWMEQTLNDEEFGGHKLDESARRANEAVRAVADDDFRKLLTDFGLGNHLSVMRTFNKVYDLIADDSLEGKGNPDNEKKSVDQILWKDMKPE